jgi:hypothetical protein
MRKFKYLKLFEAFESSKLSKTLGFIDNQSKSQFINWLHSISNNLDFPMSQLSDDLFEYLPFNKALRKTVELNTGKKIPCVHESEWILGEFCKDGKIKRTWGSHTRMVECPNCLGKGFIELQPENPTRLIKFWFDKDGKWINATGTDGKERVPEYYWNIPPSKMSKNISDYEEIGKLKGKEVSKLPSGSMVNAQIVPYRDPVLCYVYQYPNWGKKRALLFQSQFRGDYVNLPYDYDRREGYNFGSYYWAVTFDSDIVDATLLKPKGSETSDSKDYYLLNSYIENVGNLKLSKKCVKDELKNAHFAIVLDLEKLKSKDYKTVTSYRKERAESKEGALKLKSDEAIRKENLERYTDMLIKSYKMDDSVKNIKRIISVGLGSRPLDFISVKYNFDYIERLITDFYLVGIQKDESIISDYKWNININLKNIYDRVSSKTKSLNAASKSGKEILMGIKDKDPESYEKMKIGFDIWEKWEELNKKLSDKIKSFDANSIEELELNWGKILTINKMIESGRYRSLEKLKRISYYTESYGLYNQLREYISVADKDKYYEDLKKLENLIDKL